MNERQGQSHMGFELESSTLLFHHLPLERPPWNLLAVSCDRLDIFGRSNVCGNSLS